MKPLSLRVLKIFEQMKQERLDLHVLFEPAGSQIRAVSRRFAALHGWGVQHKTRAKLILPVYCDPGIMRLDRRYWLRPHT